MMRFATLGRTYGGRMWACAAAAAATASITVAFADQAPPAGRSVTDDAKDTFDARKRDKKVYLKPDLDATAFSAQNGYFFANMSKLAYQDEHNIKKTLEEMEDCKGLHEHFQFHESKKGRKHDFLEKLKDLIKDTDGFFQELKDVFEGVRDLVQDTECFVAANDDVILVVFRGTSEPEDWLTNVRGAPRGIAWCSDSEGCTIHRGFDDAVGLMWEPLHKQIMELYGDGKGRKLYIAGHSLGGALATVAAARLAFEDDINIAGVYTVGSPRVFDPDFARKFDAKVNHDTAMKDKVFRGRNNNDVITDLPPILPPPFDYAHIGTEVYFDRSGTIDTASWRDRLLGLLSALLHGNPADGIADHKVDAYITLFEDTVVAKRLSLLDKAKSFMHDAVKKVMPASDSEKGDDEL
eukprot:g8095.t1